MSADTTPAEEFAEKPPDFSQFGDDSTAKTQAAIWYLMTSNVWIVKEQSRARKERQEIKDKLARIQTQLTIIGLLLLPVLGAVANRVMAKMFP